MLQMAMFKVERKDIPGYKIDFSFSLKEPDVLFISCIFFVKAMYFETNGSMISFLKF